MEESDGTNPDNRARIPIFHCPCCKGTSCNRITTNITSITPVFSFGTIGPDGTTISNLDLNKDKRMIDFSFEKVTCFQCSHCGHICTKGAPGYKENIRTAEEMLKSEYLK